MFSFLIAYLHLIRFKNSALLFILVPELSIRPYQRGFFCNDESLRLPYKDDTIPPGLLVVILLIIGVGIVGLRMCHNIDNYFLSFSAIF